MGKNWKDEAKGRMKQLAQGKTFKLKEGVNQLRLLPNRDAVLEYIKLKKKNGKASWKAVCEKHAPFIEFVACRDVGPDKKFIRSGKEPGGGGKCWIVDKLIPSLEQSKSKDDRSKAKAMAPQEQFIVQVAARDSDGEWSGPYFFYVPNPLRPGLLQKIVSPTRQYDNPVKGYVVTITRTGTGKFDTKYSAVEPDDEPTPTPGSILKKVKPFSEVCPAYNEKDQKDAWGDELPDASDGEDEDGFQSEDDDDLDTVEETPKRKRKRKRKTKPAPEPELEDDDDDDDDDDAEEETPEPKRKRKRKTKAKPKPEPEPEEDDEEEPPKRKRKTKAKPKPEPEPEEDDDDFDGDLDEDDDAEDDNQADSTEDDDDEDDEDDDEDSTEDDDDEDDDDGSFDDDDVPF